MNSKTLSLSEHNWLINLAAKYSIQTKQVHKISVAKNLLKHIDDDQKAFLALKIVEIIGEDEPYQLDPETIYFVTNLLNKMDLVTIRNKVLNSALPLRT